MGGRRCRSSAGIGGRTRPANVEAIVTVGGLQPAVAAAEATAAIPIVASAAGGLVKHFNRPGGNLTGLSFMTGTLTPKRLEILTEVVPGTGISVLANPAYSEHQRDREAVENAAHAVGVQVRFVMAGTDAALEPAFASLADRRVGGLLIAADPFFNSRRERLVALAARYAVPTLHEWRESVAAGGLISYGPSLTSMYRLLGTYAGKILNGTEPADLTVEQPTKLELVINLNTSRALGLTIPPAILARADAVVE